MTAPDFVIVGAQKAGSTYLGACLATHPGIYLCPDEVPFYEDPFFLNSDPAELNAVFRRAEPGQLLGIHRPEYLARPECPERIHEANPGARILAVFRDPISRAVSAYCWYVQFGLLPVLPAEIGLTRILDGELPGYPRAQDVIEFGLYARQLATYIDVFGRGQVFPMLIEDLNRSEGIHAALRFLGLDPAPPAAVRRHNEGVYELRRLRFLRLRRRFVTSWERESVYTYRPRRLRRPLAFIPNAAILAIDRLLLARLFGNSKPQLSPELTGRLAGVYRSDIAELSGLIGRDFSDWSVALAAPEGR